VKESKKFGPAFLCFSQVWRFRVTLQPLIQLYGHRREELSLVNSIAQMLAIGAAPGHPEEA
jgi:hypothetical protein